MSVHLRSDGRPQVPSKVNAKLPHDEAERLRELRRSPDPQALYVRALALLSAGWPLRAVGEPLGVTRVGVRSWKLTAQKNPDLVERATHEENVPRLPVFARGSATRATRIYPRVPAAELERLRELAPLVRTIRGGTPADSPARAAAREYEALIYHNIVDRGVPAMHVARELGVTRRAIVARVERMRATAAGVAK